MIRSITLRLEGNNGVHLDEVKLVTHTGSEFLWLFSSPNLAHGGWLDGDNTNDDILPAQTLSIADASARLPTDATPTVRLSVGTVTSMQSGGSADGSRVSRHDIAGIWVAFFQECQQYGRCGQVEMVVFGSGGHVGPLRLTSTDFISAAQKSTLQVPAAIGDFAAIKLCKSAMLSRFVALSASQTLKCVAVADNAGTDGWRLEEISAQLPGIPTPLAPLFLGHFSPVLRRLFAVLLRFPASWRQDGENGRKMA